MQNLDAKIQPYLGLGKAAGISWDDQLGCTAKSIARATGPLRRLPFCVASGEVPASLRPRQKRRRLLLSRLWTTLDLLHLMAFQLLPK